MNVNLFQFLLNELAFISQTNMVPFLFQEILLVGGFRRFLGFGSFKIFFYSHSIILFLTLPQLIDNGNLHKQTNGVHNLLI